MQLLSNLKSYADSFVPEKFRRSADELYRARIFVGICSSISAIVLAVLLVSIIISFFSSVESNVVSSIYLYVIMLSLLAIFLGLLFLYKKTAMHNLCSNGLSLFSLLGVFAGVIVSGGPAESPASFLVTIPPLLSFCLTGRRYGLIWAGIAGLLFLVLAVMQLSGFEFPNDVKPEDKPVNTIVDWSIAYILTMVIILIYDRMNDQLKKQRDEEKGKYRDIASSALESQVVTESADALAESGDKLLEYAIQQKTAIEQLAATAEQLGATAEQNSILTSEAKSALQHTEMELKAGNVDILQLVSSMNEIESLGQEIQTINNLINDLSYQTNILSLNAMIEASRAGDDGGGFKVVALEVKRLAERSAKAADNINTVLAKNFDAVQIGVGLSEKTQERFQSISSTMDPLNTSIQNVSDASQEQALAIRQIMDGLEDIDKAIEANKGMAESTANAANELRENAQSLVTLFDKLDEQ